jgi:DNA-binding transcriptional MerR regulator
MPRRAKTRKVDPVLGEYGITVVAKLTGLHPVRLHRWDETGFISPSLSAGGRGRGNRRKYSFQDIVALRVAARLRESVSLQALRRVAEYIRQLEDVGNPFAERLVAVHGDDVEMVEADQALSLLKSPGQYRMVFPLDLEIEARRLKEDIKRLAA